MTFLSLIFWSWKNKPPSSPRIGKWVKYQTPNHKSQIAKPISAKLSPAFLLYLFTQPLFSASLLMTNDQWLMTFLSLSLFSQPLYSAFLLMTNDQWPFSFSASFLCLFSQPSLLMTNDQWLMTFLSLSLFSQPLFSASFLSLFTNDQWPMTNDHIFTLMQMLSQHNQQVFQS